MARLIDADKFEVYSHTLTSLDFDAGVLSVLEKLDAAPTVDAAPVRHGHWIRVSLIGVFECSECGNQIIVADSKFAKEVCKWCLHCGAKMDEVTK